MFNSQLLKKDKSVDLYAHHEPSQCLHRLFLKTRDWMSLLDEQKIVFGVLFLDLSCHENTCIYIFTFTYTY